MADDEQPDDAAPPDAQGFINADINAKAAAWGIGQNMPWLINNFVQAFVGVIGVVIRLTTRIATEAVSALNTLLEQDNPELGRMATTILGTLFGQDITAAIPGGIINPGNLQDTAGAVGHAVLGAVFGSIDLSGGATLAPGTDRAEAYLGAITEMTVRGFLLDVLEELVPHWHLQFVHNLEESLISGLGLGRVARTVLHPIVNTLIAEPAQWAINLAYRPKLASPETAIAMWHRGDIGDGELDDILGRQGYGADHIGALKIQHQKHVELASIDVLFGHAVLSDGDASARLKLLGYDDQGAAEVWEATKLKHFESWYVREAEGWLSKLDAGLVDEGQFVDAVRALPLYPGVADQIVAIGHARLEAPRKALSIAELFTAWTNNILTQGEVNDRLVRMGYSEEDANTLLLTRLAIGNHQHEVADQKAAAQTARAAAIAAAKQARVEAAAEKAAAAAAARAAKAAQLAQQKAQAKSDAETRREFVAAAAEQKRQLVATQHAAAQLSSDQLSLANAQIAADTAALLAQIDGQVAQENATFEQQKLDLQAENREADLEEALANVDVAAEIDAKLRQQTVALKQAANDQTLAEKLGDLDTLYADRADLIQTDLANALDAVDVSVLPGSDERAAAATSKTAALDATLARRLDDLAAEYDDKQAAADKEHGDGTITDKTYETRSDTIANSRAQGARAAQQSHDLAVQALTGASAAPAGTPIAAATKTKTSLQTRADAATAKLGTDKIAAQLAAQQSHDKTALDLQVIQQQIGPITAAEAARRKLTLTQQDDAAKRAAQVNQAEIAKSQADAAAVVSKAAATAQAAHQRLAALQTATGARESATAAGVAAQTSLEASQEAAREALERTIAAHQPGIPSSSST